MVPTTGPWPNFHGALMLKGAAGPAEQGEEEAMTPGVTAGERFRSWADIQANAARGAGGLAALGVREDDSVALMLRNDFATFEVNMAAGQLGAYAVPINWHFTPEEAGYILARLRAPRCWWRTPTCWRRSPPAFPPDVKVLVVPTPTEIAARL